tara:strand:+ start:72 stop:275 length:204 start_codon:yes stop_codon:yes gene_type:complete
MNKVLKFLLDKKNKGLPMNIGEAMSKTNTWREGKVESEANTFRVQWEKNNLPIEPDFDWENEVLNAR